ncbi:MAG TPA: carboxypeptidase-like regulatory domain-containing protein, partial [Ginsengibacter sp.]
MAQQRTITGKVTSAYGNPLVGASVLVVGQQTGERTGADGSFSIKVPANAKILEISYIGYESFRVSIVDQNNVAVSLQESSTSLNAVVVTGYSTQRRKDISGSVATVDISDAKKIPATSSEQLLQGQAAGVTVI